MAVTDACMPKQDDKLVQFVTLEEAFKMMNQEQQEYRQHTKYFEICEECKKVLDYLLTMRRDQLTELKNEVEGVFKLPHLKKGEENV
jgi:endonuclease/exonuclease/phosphatase (EEP) superfamily protein YafD